MDTSVFDSQIEAARNEIRVLLKQMEETAARFLNATGQFASEWYPQTVEQIVTARPEAVKAAGIDKLKSLKAELKTLQEAAKDKAQKHGNLKIYWAHREEQFWLFPKEEQSGSSSGPYYEANDYFVYDTGAPRAKGFVKGPDKLRPILVNVLGEVGTLLNKYGLIPENTRTPRRSGESLIFIGDDVWSPDMVNEIRQYKSQMEQLHKLRWRIFELQREKAKAEAKNLWDQA